MATQSALLFTIEFGCASAKPRPANTVLPRVTPAARRVEGSLGVRWTMSLRRLPRRDMRQPRSA